MGKTSKGTKEKNMVAIQVLIVSLSLTVTRCQDAMWVKTDCSPSFSDFDSGPPIHIDSSRYVSTLTCASTYLIQNCYCDPMCSILKDCCPGYTPREADVPTLPASVFSCACPENYGPTDGVGMHMVTRCPADWPDNNIKAACESRKDANDTLLTLPVSEPNFKIVFRNMYCAYCNNIYDFTFWELSKRCKWTCNPYIFSLNCKSPPEPSNECVLQQENPFKTSTRKCPLRNVIDSCDESLQSVSQEDVEKCTNSSFSLVYSSFSMYRNRHCAACRGVSEADMYCLPKICGQQAFTGDPYRSYSYGMLVDFNSGHLKKNDGTLVEVEQRCKDNEILDLIFDECREIFCPSSMIAKKGKCVHIAGGVPGNFHTQIMPGNIPTNCTWTKFEPDEFEVINGSQLHLFSTKNVYSVNEFKMSDSNMFICIETNETCSNCTTSVLMFTFDKVEIILSIVTLIVSLVSLAITFVIYIYFNELLNTPGKILVSLIVSLFLAQLTFLVSSSADGNRHACKAVSVIMHYFFIAAFCWMNIVALDLWITFSNQFVAPGSGSNKRFIKFSSYGWLVPLLIVSIAVSVDFSDIQEDYASLKPRYGVGVCWITSRDGLLLFFAGPLAVFKLFDIVAFIFTSIYIIRAKKEGSMARQNTDVCSFFISIKLSLVMGLTWVFAFVATIGNNSVLWYLFIVFNGLQGLFIAISFICTAKVQRLIKKRYEEVSSSKSSTHLASLTPSCDRK